LVRLPGLADHFEKEDPGMHKTNTVDYAVNAVTKVFREKQMNELLAIALDAHRGLARCSDKFQR
jgi:hypothetical protein